MPARDTFHDAVRNALIKEQWNITDDPFCIRLIDTDINVYVDLAAERIIAAEKENQKIAVEVKSFVGTSFITDFHSALGQFLDYRVALRDQEPGRHLYLAIPVDTYNAFFKRRFIQLVCQEYQVTLIVFDPKHKEILEWKKYKHTEII
ncbi:MAG: fatty-acid oxidation protein subunit alpha [Desulfobacterales bacterium]|nr:fatty-acid oxidation protein subunit alpha [Desulfobacterales bacterium]